MSISHGHHSLGTALQLQGKVDRMGRTLDEETRLALQPKQEEHPYWVETSAKLASLLRSRLGKDLYMVLWNRLPDMLSSQKYTYMFRNALAELAKTPSGSAPDIEKIVEAALSSVPCSQNSTEAETVKHLAGDM